MLHDTNERQLLEHHAKPVEQHDEPEQEMSDAALAKS
jgi:hypothetical protein